VYVGDRATLALPLAGSAAKSASVDLDPKRFPLSPDLEIHRVTLERRPSGSRLLVEFSAYTPGVLELPPIEIGGEGFAGLRVTIRSILASEEAGAAALSAPALPLAIPGTGLLVYGTMGVLALILLLSLLGGAWGRRRLGGWILRWKKRRLIFSMSGIEKRLRRALSRDGSRRDILNTLSTEFRSFLSFFTGENCRAMTAAELGRLPPLAAIDKDAAAEPLALLSGDFLEVFFRRCDALRFSGSPIITGDALAMLGDLRRFLETLYRAERGQFRQKERAQ
jgi:hypothetical protein